MPTSVGSHDSHSSIPDSLPSLSDHDSIRSAASTHSSLSNNSAYWANPPNTQALPLGADLSLYGQKDMYGTQTRHNDSTRASGPQRSSTIKASNQSAASHNASSSSRSPANAIPIVDAMTASRTLAASASSPPVLHSLVFSSSGLGTFAASKSAESSSSSSQRKLPDAQLHLDEAAPRLSMSSTGSGSNSELATPENLHQAWPYDDVDGSALSALQSSTSSSTHLPSESKEAESFSNGTLRAERFAPEDHLRPPSREVDAASNALDRLVLQRPAKLERLSSAATNATARNSARSDESPQTATQSPRNFQAPDLSSLRFTSGFESLASDLAQSSRSTKVPTLDTDIPPRASMTSPDSWRSLLPEHDPYFASDSQMRASQGPRSASPQSLHPFSNLTDMDPYVLAKTSPRATAPLDRMSSSSFDTARTSFSSSISGYSTMSMSGPSKSSMQSQDSARSDSWRSLLPDDDRYHASRDAGHSNGQRGLEASPSLTSPSLSDRLDSPGSFDGQDSNHRSAFFALHGRPSPLADANDSESAARRHASFSSVEPNNSKQYAATRSMLASMRESARSLGSSLSASANYLSSKGIASLDAPSMTPVLSNSTEDDSSERDSWPTSRCGRYGHGGYSSPVSTGPMTPEAGHLPHSRSSLAAVLSQEEGGVARVDSPSHVSKTSDSVLHATEDGLLATTTTTTTSTVTTTTTQFLSPEQPNKARSEAVYVTAEDDDDEDGLQSQPMKSRTSSCSISTPISPPSLPFLERRPAPPETDLVIETERHRYTLVTRLPGFSLDCITLATKHHSQSRTLHIVADKWDTEGGGHFERRITFPEKECDLKNVKAEFDGNILKVYVPRKTTTHRFSSASSATF